MSGLPVRERFCIEGVALMKYLIVFFVCLSFFVSGCRNKPVKEFESCPNYKNGYFYNMEPLRHYHRSFKSLFKMIFKGEKNRRPKNPLPTLKLSQDDFADSPSQDLRFYWLGQSSIILELEGKRILIDPMLSKRASPFSWGGPKRFQPSPLMLKDLKDIHVDLVLISHNHYDHLDKATIKALTGKNIKFIVPLGVDRYLTDWGVKKENITTLNWWQETIFDDLKIVSCPSRHFSARTPFRQNETLWTSWAIVGKAKKIYFSGDTGMSRNFEKMAEKFGHFDLAFITIGAYDPFWPDSHLTPEQSVEVAKTINAKLTMPIHWGTFNFARHAWYDPILRFTKEAKRENLKILTPKMGEKVIPGSHTNENWWENYI
jgi:L-ascorbate metabolism protein UlaG (beta-lactamase superfamily)